VFLTEKKLSLLFKDASCSGRLEIYRDPFSGSTSRPSHIERIFSGFSSSFVELEFSKLDEEFLIYGLTDGGLKFELWEIFTLGSEGYNIRHILNSLYFPLDLDMPLLFTIHEVFQMAIFESAQIDDYHAIDLKNMRFRTNEGGVKAFDMGVEGDVLVSKSRMVTWNSEGFFTTEF
jgi:hypothetical protein